MNHGCRKTWLVGLGFVSSVFLLLARPGLAAELAVAAVRLPAFPGAVGWAASTPGGRGGAILRVTTLSADGPGSLQAALATVGPRIIVFEVGGVIDLGERTLKIDAPFATIAGQTAPSPGITLIRGGIDIATHDVVVQHIRVRPGDGGRPKRSGSDYDAISTLAGAHDVIVDHCSLTWATDENLSASGPRFEGATPDDWRRGTSHRITFSHNLIAEGLADSVHVKGEHSKGSLIHDNASDILIVGNLYAHNKERNALFKGGARGAVVNNLIYDPGRRAIHYNLIAGEWGSQPYQVGEIAVIGNVLRGGPSTIAELPLVMIGGSGDLRLYERDNIAIDAAGRALPARGSYSNPRCRAAAGQFGPGLCDSRCRCATLGP
jgi:pectate lyase